MAKISGVFSTWVAGLLVWGLILCPNVGCSSDPAPVTGNGGSTAVVGGAGQAGNAASGAAVGQQAGASGGMAGAMGVAGASGGAGAGGGSGSGGQAVGGAAGASGAGGNGGGGAGGTAGAAGAAGAPVDPGFWPPTGPQKQWTCPAGALPDQEMSGRMEVCNDFQLKHNWSEGPTWIASQGAFFFTNFPINSATGGDIVKYTPGGDCEFWLEDVGCNGLGVSPSGNLLAACQTPRAVVEYDVLTKEMRIVADMADGEMLDSPNDLIARSDGNVYFSNRTAELGNRPVGLGEGLVRIDPMGVVSVIQMGGLNGIALSPDENLLHVVGMGTFPLDAAGLPGEEGDPTPGGDGIAVDCAGNISNNGTNSAFGGTDGMTLLIVGNQTIETAQMTVPGLP